MSNSNIHPSAVLGRDVVVAPTARIGAHCYVEGKTTIGANSTLVGGITLVGDAMIGENCVVEAGVSMTSAQKPGDGVASPLQIGSGTVVGAGSILVSGVSIGANAKIGAGTVVVRDVPAYAIIEGNPARITGYATSSDQGRTRRSFETKADRSGTQVASCSVTGVEIYTFPRIRDLRGDLSVGEFGRNVPFEPKRYFLVYDVPSAETRGEHAHKVCKQFLICVAGRVSVVVDDGVNREEIELNAPNLGLYIPPRIWGIQYKYSPGSVLLVHASHYYDPADYIRDYDLFLAECGSSK